MFKKVDTDIFFRVYSDNILFSNSDFDLNSFFNQRKNTVKMDTKVQNFHGYGSDIQDFLDSLNGYFLANNIDDDARKRGVFQCHLEGPAKVWFRYLNNEHKDTYEHLIQAFNDKFSAQFDSAQVQIKTVEFVQLKWQQGQTICDYYSDVLSKGKALGKNDSELAAQFICGLPDQLAFFVRARNPTTLDEAFDNARSGETFGYHTQEKPVATHAIHAQHHSPHVSEMQQLKDSVQQIQQQLMHVQRHQQQQHLLHHHQQYQQQQYHQQQYQHSQQQPHQYQQPAHRQQQSQPYQSQQYHQQQYQQQQQQYNMQPPPSDVCQRCYCPGHLAKECNMMEGTRPRLHFQCPICRQRGHGALRCVQGNGLTPATQPK